MQQHLIAIDLDGTALNDQSQLSRRTIQTLRQLDQLGHLVLIATGRPYRNAIDLYRQLNIDAPIITFNGAYCHDPNRRHWLPSYHLPLDRQIVYELVKHQEEFGIELLCVEGREMLYATSTNIPTHPMYQVQQDRLKRLDLDSFSEEPTAITIFSPQAQLASIRQKIQTHFGNSVYLRLWADALPCLEVSNPQVNKAKGVLTVANFYHIDPAFILAFGDEENDLEMIEAAGLGVAMANATPSVQAIADAITPNSNDQDGLANYLEDYFNLSSLSI